MHIESLREFCLSLPGVTESFPFGETTLVFKVMTKMFALTGLDDPVSVNLKCDPEYALELRDQYPEQVQAGWHMNKKHWNTVQFEGPLSERQMEHLVRHSYEQVVAKLKKSEREALKNL